MKYTTIVSESWWYIDDGEADREIHDDMMMLYLFHVGAKWWCHFIVIQSVKKTSIWHDMHKKKTTNGKIHNSFKKNVGLEFKLILWLRIPVHNKRCTWNPDSEKTMHFWVPVERNKKKKQKWCTSGFWFRKIDALEGSGSQKLMHLGVPVWRSSGSEKSMHLGVPVRKSMRMGVLIRKN